MTGCGGERGDSTASVTTTSTSEIKLTGSVGDGPVVNATIQVKDANGKIILNSNSDSQANYSITLPSKTLFPVVITSTGGIDLVTGMAPDFTMKTVAFKKSELNTAHTVNINPFSTFIVEIANNMSGGLTTTNVETAKQTIRNSFSFGLDNNVIADPISTTIDNTNIAMIIKTSETLGEMIRRTRDAITSSGNTVTGDFVINKLSADLADQLFDGKGSNVSMSVSATAKIVTGAVMIESIQNELKVNSNLAISAMDSALTTLQPDSTVRMKDVPVSLKAINQTIESLNALRRLQSDSNADNIINALESITQTSTVDSMRVSLSGTSTLEVTNILNQLPLASDTELQAIFAIESVAPVISSQPVLTATVGSNYSYDVDATDANGDQVSYSLAQAPSGMSINADTGLISWTPIGSQIGTQAVTITVSDDSGQSLTSTQSFNIATISQTSIVIRVNAGGGQFTDSSGQLWSQDYGYNLGQAATFTEDVAATTDDTIYNSIRWHSTYTDSTAPELEYTFNIPNGMYAVRLYFSEQYTKTRIFDVNIEGNTIIDGLDVRKEVGTNTALIKSANVDVQDGIMNIKLLRDTGSPRIAGIEIIQVESRTIFDTDNVSAINVAIDNLNKTSPDLQIIGDPLNGSASVTSNGIAYVPSGTYQGEDNIIVQYINDSGNVVISTITVDVSCNSCSKEAVLVLNWQPNTEAVTGYKIYYGPDSNTVMTLASDIKLQSGIISSSTPSIEYLVTTDLGFYPGENICFKIQAYSDNAESPLTDPVCGTI